MGRMNSTVLILLAAAAAFWYLSKKGTTTSADTTPTTSGGTVAPTSAAPVITSATQVIGASPPGGVLSVWTGVGPNLSLPVSLTIPSATATAPPLGTPGMTTDQAYAIAAARGGQHLGDIYNNMMNYSLDLGQDFTAAQWNSILLTVSNVVPPDPSVVWGYVPSRTMRLPEYWANVAPWLAANRGMSGLGATRLVRTHGGWTA